MWATNWVKTKGGIRGREYKTKIEVDSKSTDPLSYRLGQGFIKLTWTNLSDDEPMYLMVHMTRHEAKTLRAMLDNALRTME